MSDLRGLMKFLVGVFYQYVGPNGPTPPTCFHSLIGRRNFFKTSGPIPQKFSLYKVRPTVR
jgi:hypothetical protein